MSRRDQDPAGEEQKRSRSFIGIPLPPADTEVVAEWQRRALGEGMRAVAPANLHITLAFLGDRDPGELARAGEALRAALRDAGAMRIALAGEPIGLPRRRPRVIAFAAEGPMLMPLRAALVAELAGAGIDLGDPRPFHPHLSVARVRGGHRRSSIAAELARFPSGEGGHTFDAVRVALYRSELRSQGARYSVLADVELPRGSGG
ncbi:MAG: RNA 2',3'-cyclic phosphodiesterase [Solirubrobacterales bacterium]|nr:RNA 2',3'-cyclic phosphodiesterase [Solirubrobacterales bacterium]